MRVVLTGFDPFHTLRWNPSAVVMADARVDRRATVERHLLSTTYRGAAQQISWITANRLDLLVLLGYSRAVEHITIESMARNRDHSPLADNDGVVSSGPILDGGPDVLGTTAPVPATVASLTAQGVPFVHSIDAGGFVCNHTYYRALGQLRRQPNAGCVFIHLPMWSTKQGRDRVLVAVELALEAMIGAVSSGW